MKKTLKKWLENLKNRFWNTKTARTVLNLLFVASNIVSIVLISDKMILGLSFAGSFVIYVFVDSIIKAVNDVNSEMPNFGKRFTKKRQDGSVVIEDGKLYEAILYLYAIEEYIEKGR